MNTLKTKKINAIIDEASNLLPHQGILENFVHHNPLEHFEHLKWDEAIKYVNKECSYMSPGERFLNIVHHDPILRVNNALVDLCAPFLDRGAAKWAPKYRNKGFLYFFAFHENLGFSKWRGYARKTASTILPQLNENIDISVELAEKIIEENLIYFGIPEEEYTSCIRSMLLELKGWAGMFRRMESHPNEAPANTKISLLEFCAVQTILVRSSLSSIFDTLGTDLTFAEFIKSSPKERKEYHLTTSHPSAIALADQNAENQKILESEYEKVLLRSIEKEEKLKMKEVETPYLQLYTCIDDRCCSLRRNIENQDPNKIETFGVAGFFGVPIKFNAAVGGDQMILAPEGQNPSEVIIESSSNKKKAFKWRKIEAKIEYYWENLSFNPFGSLLLTAFFPFTYSRLFLLGLFPKVKQKISKRIKNIFYPEIYTEIKNPFTIEQSALMLAKTLKDIGNHKKFAPIIIILGHGSKSVNNPFAAAYNCGACGGREGGPNARLLAIIANNKSVRDCLKKNHAIDIPDETYFVGGNHNTTNDTIKYYDVENLPSNNLIYFEKAKAIITEALARNALERCQKLFLAKNVKTKSEALEHVFFRSIDSGEVRPELNHATNAAVIVGRRVLTKNHFLDRRVFLPSYNPFNDDSRGTNLEHVLTPALIVSSGINLEYLFSTITDLHGAGTKAPLNIVGNIGVTQGTSGDLRTGLPSQMTEMHIPIRALFVIDSPIERVESVLNRNTRLLNLVRNEWVRFFVRDPYSGVIYKQKNGEYLPVEFCGENEKDYIPFTEQKEHGINLAKKEDIVYYATIAGMILSCVIPMLIFGEPMNPRSHLIAFGGTALALPIVGFARRYLHGEYLFKRIFFLTFSLLSGFNLVALAPSLEIVILGWGIFGFASTFLIGTYNDRPTVRNNATYAFGVYRISDFAMILAASFAHGLPTGSSHQLVALGLLVAAIFKSSQFPLTGLFVRSMEGPTPCSAIGYTGISAHAGIVLLTTTLPLWFEFSWTRVIIGLIGGITVFKSTLKSNIRAERKGALANATSGTIGLIYIVLAMGYSNLALLLSFGHASFRMIQLLRTPNKIADIQKLKMFLGHNPWPKIIPDSFYKLCWRLKRFETDLHLFNFVNRISKVIWFAHPYKFSKFQKIIITIISVIIAGFPSPLSYFFEELLIEMFHTNPVLAIFIMLTQFIVSIVLIRFLLKLVLSPKSSNKSKTIKRIKEIKTKD